MILDVNVKFVGIKYPFDNALWLCTVSLMKFMWRDEIECGFILILAYTKVVGMILDRSVYLRILVV